ncbi:MAG: DinB family protein [Bacteroidia bacterium]
MSELLKNFDTFEKKRQNLIHSLENIGDEKLNTAPKVGEWSAIQVMWHLISAEGNAVKYVRKKALGKNALQTAGWGSSARLILLNFVLALPIKFKAPKIVEAVPERVSWEETKKEWEKVRQELRELLASFDENEMRKPLFKHPLVGKMDLYQMLSFMESHFDRHLGQIKRALSPPN